MINADCCLIQQLPHLYLHFTCMWHPACKDTELCSSSNFAHFRISWLALHWLPIKVRSTCKLAWLCYHCHSSTAPSYVADMWQKKPSHTRKIFAPARTQCVFSFNTVRQYLSVVHFLLLFRSATPFQMMSDVLHHCQSISVVQRPTCFVQFTIRTIFITVCKCMAWLLLTCCSLHSNVIVIVMW